MSPQGRLTEFIKDAKHCVSTGIFAYRQKGGPRTMSEKPGPPLGGRALTSTTLSILISEFRF
jgi:hypothetical protein